MNPVVKRPEGSWEAPAVPSAAPLSQFNMDVHATADIPMQRKLDARSAWKGMKGTTAFIHTQEAVRLGRVEQNVLEFSQNLESVDDARTDWQIPRSARNIP